VRVSAVIPTYNCGHMVVDAVRSALAQTYLPIEVIVIDDGSTDDTRDRLAEFGSSVRYIYQTNRGVSAARNRGVRESSGDAIAFLDSDDVWHPRKLERQVECLNAHPELGLVGTMIVDWPNEPFPENVGDDSPAPTVIHFDNLLVRNRMDTSSILVRKSVLEKVGEFDCSMQGPEDYDLWLRIAQMTAIANLPRQLTGYRMIAGSVGKNAIRMEAGMRAILQKVETNGVFRGRPVFRRKVWGYFHFSCGLMHGKGGNYPAAMRHMIASLASYPAPYVRNDIRTPFIRYRIFLRSFLKWAGRRSSGANANSRSPISRNANEMRA